MNLLTFRIIFIYCCLCLNYSFGEDSSCGRPIGIDYLLENDRIVGGYDVGYYRYPWYAALMQRGQVSCGAALIGPRTVLTAAHCYKDYLDLSAKGSITLESIFTVKLGVYNICISEKTQREYKIEKVQVHELYGTHKPYYDICLLTLANDTSDYMPICLPKKSLSKRPPEGTVPGLGTLRYLGNLPCTVHEARLLIYSDDECKSMINRTGNNVTAITHAFCAGYLQGGIDTCQGDSGGPLQIMNKQGDFYLLGIVSFGFHCAQAGLLGMYTDVSQFIDWIEQKSGLNPNVLFTKKEVSSTTILPETGPSDVTSTSTLINRPIHQLKPFWRPINIFILRNRRIVTIKKSVLHRPISRSNKKS